MTNEQLSKKIEEAYEELIKTMDQIGSLGQIVEQLKTNTQSIIEKYVETLEPAKIAQLREQSKKSLNQMIEDVNRIQKAMIDYDVVEHQISEYVTSFTVKMNNFENILQGTTKIIQDMDTKLLKLIKEAEKNQVIGQKRFYQASQLFNASAEVEKYDELLKLQKENNKLLKEFLNKKQDNFPKNNIKRQWDKNDLGKKNEKTIE